MIFYQKQNKIYMRSVSISLRLIYTYTHKHKLFDYTLECVRASLALFFVLQFQIR